MTKKLFEENRLALDEKSASVESVRRLLFREAAKEYLDSSNNTISFDDIRDHYKEYYDSDEFITTDYALFCRETARLFGKNIIPRFYEETEASDFGESRISYLKNAYSDRAYSIFAASVDNPTAVYFSSFREICEEVFYGRSRFAILPVYTSSEGQLSSFRKLISKYDLKISKICEIDTENESVTSFSLLQKGLSFSISEEDNKNLFLSVSLPKEHKLIELISSLSSTGAEIKAINTNSAEYSDSELCFDILLTVSSSDLSGLFLFLECSQLRYNLVGDYNIIN